MQEDEKPLAAGAALNDALANLTTQISNLSENLDRMNMRLDVLSEECERTASATQRLLLRQQSLAQGVSRIESSLAGR